ncbi:hypothetical protein LUZ61_006371 [Rhynchospora tenuis]|uniref:F-box domain-containing protein n=1 Tax=Rhynchospora tenuis TaxID=198213 RepID=A0AAD5ZRI5_9POAL|nr:hypothetical protein LUZ61_006371 [Rhynchospora tenuis]
MEDPPSNSLIPDLIPDLPDEISHLIIARVPPIYHRTLCHVSRSWRSFLLGRLLFTLRSSLHYTEPTLCLHVMSHSKTDSSRIMILNRGHSRSQFLPSPPLPTALPGSACVTAGPFLFTIGGSRSGSPSNVVQILDMSVGGQWSLGPRMSTARKNMAACFLDGRIYVIGGCIHSSDVWAESLNPFDRNPQWVPIDSPMDGPMHLQRSNFMYDSVVVSGQILAKTFNQDVVAYSLGENTGSCSAWVSVPEGLKLLRWIGTCAVVNGILYSVYDSCTIKAYDAVTDKWCPVRGIDINLPKFPTSVKLVNFHGVLCVIWLQSSIENNKSDLVNWLGIRVTDFGSKGVHGSILWWEIVALGVPCGSPILHSVVVEF